ncbi:MAG TPA: hypothetical protein VEH27_13065 [Methylomirabilota bacterium]|nr:hypothetical protein [Methylomirabilota bacterium]
MKLFLMGALALLLVGCATTQNWEQRVGVYRMDDAITELGPPEKQAQLADGTVVAEWLRVRGGTQVIATRPHFYRHHRGFAHFHDPFDYRTVRWPDNYLRLTFSPDGRLMAAKRIAK